MSIPNEPLQLPAGEFVSYPADRQRPYDLFEIYAYAIEDGDDVAALVTWYELQDHLPPRLRRRKRRKFTDLIATPALEHTVQQHFPEARFIDTPEEALVEFSLTLPEGAPRVPAQVEHRLLTETRAVTFYEQVHDMQSPMNVELAHRIRLGAVGTEWQRYFIN